MLEENFEYELKFIPEKKSQIKLLASLKNDTIDGLIATITSALGISDSYELKSLDSEALVDVYHDTDDLTLFKEGNSLRVRHSGKSTSITAKIKRGTIDGEFKRDEYSINCDQSQLQTHINENFVDFTRTKFTHLSGKKLKPRIIVKNSRRLFIMQPKENSTDYKGFKAKLSFDMFTYVLPDKGISSHEMYELEIEALNDEAIAHMADLSKHIRNVVSDLSPSEFSKYERGINEFKLNKSTALQIFNNWPEGRGYNWVMLVISLGAIIIGLTISVLN